MRWVIVGAGAVGQVLGWHAQQGGAQLAFRVRDRGRVLQPFRLHRRGRSGESTFEARLFDRDEEVAAFDPDLVVLTVPSDALAGPWLPALVAAAPRAGIVAMEPGRAEGRTLAAAAPGRAVTRGIVAFIAYQAPLRGESEVGIAYWCPPGLACPFEGPDGARIVEVLRRGGMRAVERTGLEATSAYGAAAMALYVRSLRASGWRLREWVGSSEIGLAGRAFVEAQAVLAASGARPPLWAPLLTPRAVGVGARIAARWAPLPLEAYLEWHFTKIGAQTEAHIAELVEEAEGLGLGSAAIRAVLES